jgi:DNA-directed RNA polymerase specialized sigma24 family protein
MVTDYDRTNELIERWHAGDAQALAQLLEENLDWIQGKVKARLGAELRAKAETVDFVQDAFAEFLRYGPRIKVAGRGQFRALMAQIIENVLRGNHDYFAAQRRNAAREAPLPTDTVLDISGTITRPDAAAEKNEMEAWVRLALELIEPEDRQLVLLRQWDGLEFEVCIGTTPDAARMRFGRALQKLAAKIDELRKGGER